MTSKLKRFLPFTLIAAVASVTLTAGTVLYRAKQAKAPRGGGLAEITGAKPGAKAPHIRGETKAKVTVEEFADFQCPPCAGVAAILQKLERDYQGRLRVVFRHFPLQNHQNARPAALAAEAAARQGKFWEMHDLLYENQTAWSKATEIRPLLNGYAAILGLDMTRFSADFELSETGARISADQERAASLGVTQTPTLFINNQLLPVSALSADGIRDAIEKALAPPSTTP